MDKDNLKHLVKKQDEKEVMISHPSKLHLKYEKAQRRSKFPAVAVAIVFMLFIVSLWVLFKHSRYSIDAIIAQDLQKLEQIFKEIDKDCKIIDFEHTKSYIDFLTVKEFIGSQVGAMNITYPKNWKGPYLKHNLTVLEQQYIVLKNRKNYYLVPGDGVVLANGQTIGTDIILNERSDINALMEDSNGLKSSHGALIVKIDIGRSFFKKKVQVSSDNSTLKE